MVPKFSSRSVMRHGFSEVPVANIERSQFRRSRGHKTAFDAGYLIPIFVDEALPGDTYSVSVSSVCRLSTLIVPFMDTISLSFFFFAVPNRLLWTNWVKMMGEQVDPGDSISYTVPVNTTPVGGYSVGSLYDYMGIPPGVDDLDPAALHFRAYNKIWNEWFRHEDLQDSEVVDLGDGPDTDTDYALLRRGKRHDYFTSCLPNPQKGGTEVSLPLGSTAPVRGTGLSLGLTTGSTTGGPYAKDSTGDMGQSQQSYNQSLPAAPTHSTYFSINQAIGVVTDEDYSGLEAVLSEATAATVGEFREAVQLQKMLERDARGGTRYPELIKSHFRVENPDARMQRSEYLGGGTTPLIVTPIPQTSESSTTKQGTLTAIGHSAQSGIGFTKSFTEHCVLLGLVHVGADLTWQQGLHRMWKRSTKHDFYWPALAHLSEQEVLNREIWCDGSANDALVFGYNERWSEYRYGVSQISGILRSDAAGSLDKWHLSIDYASLPVLNASFIEDNPPIDRVIATPTEPHIIGDFYFDVVTARPMPTYSVPGLVDHF